MLLYHELIIALAVGAVTLIAYFKWTYQYWRRKNIPYIAPTIPYGNFENPLLQKMGVSFQAKKHYDEFKSKGHKHGGVFAGMRPVYMPVDLEHVKNIMMKDFQYFVDRGIYHHETADPISAHLFSIEGQKWRNLRTKLTPTFTSGKMKVMFQTVVDCAEQMIEASNVVYSRRQPFDIKEICSCFTTDVIGSCAFGLECNSFKDPNSEFRKYSKIIFGTDVERMVRTFLALNFPTVCKKFGMRIFPADASSFYSRVIKEVINYRETTGVIRNDFVQLLLDIKNSKNNGETLTLNEITAQAFIFFLAGFETSSSTMTFCLYELARKLDVQDKLREEINNVLKKHGGQVTYEAMQDMHYMQQVLDETLRIYPSVPLLNRIVTKDYTIPGTNSTLEKGTKVFISAYGIHHDPELYPNPEQFNPENFSQEAKASRHIMAFLPFGEGPRNCIGLRFGLMQAKIGLIFLLRSYKFTLNPVTPIPLTINPRTILLAAIEDIVLDVEKV